MRCPECRSFEGWESSIVGEPDIFSAKLSAIIQASDIAKRQETSVAIGERVMTDRYYFAVFFSINHRNSLIISSWLPRMDSNHE